MDHLVGACGGRRRRLGPDDVHSGYPGRGVPIFGCLCAREVTERLTQQTYLRALWSMSNFAGRCSARTWLLSIARRVAADQTRRVNARFGAEVLAGGDTIMAADRAPGRSGREDAALLRELVAGLRADRRDAFVLTQVVGLDYAAAAEVCDCPVAPVRSRVTQAREDLIRAMNHLGWPRPSITGP
jgi:RNA polymerase sigma-70 factor, ECF subfamily